MRRLLYNRIAALVSALLLAGSAACMRAEPVLTPASASETAGVPAVASAATPAPPTWNTPIPASAFMESYFRHPGDAPEVVVRDSEHGHYEYRSDALDVRIDCITTDLGRGSVTYYLVNIHLADREQLRDAFSQHGGEFPWRLARENKAVLLLAGCMAALTAERQLVADGEPVAGLQHAPGRGVDARTAIGEISEGHYFAVVADGRQPGYSVGLTLFELAGILVEHGVYEAYRLPGGRETALVFMGEHINRHAGRYAGGDPSYQARIDCGLAFGKSALVPKVTDEVEHDGNG